MVTKKKCLKLKVPKVVKKFEVIKYGYIKYLQESKVR